MKVLKNFYLHLFVYSFIQCFFFLTESKAELASKVLYSVSLFLFFLLLSQIHKNILKIGILYSYIVVMFIYPVLEIFGEPNYSFWSSVFYTDVSESISYMKVTPLSIYFYLFLYLIYTIFLLKIDYRYLKIKYISIVLLVILLVLPVKKIVQYGWQQEKGDKYFNVQPIKRTLFAILRMVEVKRDYNEVIRMSQVPSTWNIENKEDIQLSKNFVVVIGESVRKDFLNSYGFEINNTPFLNSTPHIQFENYISIAPSTVSSLVRTLSLASNDMRYELNNNLVNLAKFIGYEVIWISNQGIIGQHNSPITTIAMQSDKVSFLRKGDGDVGYNYQDKEMLPIIDKVIGGKSNKPKLIVIHMFGSHGFVCDRTQNKYDEYIISKDISCYNKSIRNLDLFLEYIYGKLKETEESFKLVYFGDHGQVVKDNLVTHGNGDYKEEFDVPLIVMGGGNKLKINEFRRGSDFLHLFSELNNVKTTNIKRDYQFISEDKIKRENRKVLNSSEKLVDYDQLKSNAVKEIVNQK